MTTPSKSVFLSYASQDADVARRICDALRAAGIEVWFDQSELRGGDAWDASIRNQIKACTLFVPLVSRNTHFREEGYFRLEWKLAVDRSHLMSAARAFLLPVVVDDTTQDDPGIPDRFREVQWTRLHTDEALTALVERVRRLLADSPSAAPGPAPAVPSRREMQAAAPSDPPGRARTLVGSRTAIVLGAVAIAIAVGGVLYLQGRTAAPMASVPSGSGSVAAFSPPPHSLAVLPFVNMSGDPKQDYFSDGLSEELLNSLVTIRDLQVAARTSSFSFKGKDVDLAEVARKLNVGAVLEGSVRKDGNHVRITAQLINAVTGYHLWSQTYDRDLKNILTLQTEIATAVTRALEGTLLTGAAAAIELGGTQNPQAFDAYLQGEKLRDRQDKESVLARIAAFDEAIRLDPGFAKAYVGKANSLAEFAGIHASSAETGAYFERSREAVRKALTIAPDLGSAHAALSEILRNGFFAFRDSQAEMERAMALAPGDIRVVEDAVRYYGWMGHADEAASNAQRAMALDPLNAHSYLSIGIALYFAHDYRKSVEALTRAHNLDANMSGVNAYRGIAYVWLGDLDAARESCALPPASLYNDVCIAIVANRQGRTQEAQQLLAKLMKQIGDAAAYQYAEIYAQWGDIPKALEWLETAYRLRDSGLAALKADTILDPLRKEARFQAIERKLNFPD
jgi:TolB-like protein/tetratricopeptide (TPR) repeat protein